MNSDPSASILQKSDFSQSVDYSFMESSKSRHFIPQVPQSSSVTPEGQSSSYDYCVSKVKKNKKKKTLKKSKIQQSNINKQGNLRNFILDPKQAAYLNQKGCPKNYSFQNIYLNDQGYPLKNKAIVISNKETKDYHQSEMIKYSTSEFRDGKLNLSEGYYFIERFINQMLEEKEVPEFFKKNLQEITKFVSAGKYYSNYNKIIRYPLNLSLLLKMIQDGRIRNYVCFKMKFQEMVLNSRFYHYLKGNLRIINCGQFLKKKLQQKFCQELNTEGNTFQQDIKVLQRKRPKIIDQKIYNQDKKTTILMDLDDEYNKYRISVMNRFFRDVCLQHQYKVETIVGKLQNIVSKYPESKVQIIRDDEVNQVQIKKKRIIKKISQQTATQSIQKSPQSSVSQIMSEPQKTKYRIVPHRIQVDLFQQMKKFISQEVQQKRDLLTFAKKIREERQQMMYHHEDSSDFSLNDDSDDL